MATMADAYCELLEAAIGHLESLKATGRRFVEVSPQSLAILDSFRASPGPAARTTRTSRPAAASSPAQPAAAQAETAKLNAPISRPPVKATPTIPPNSLPGSNASQSAPEI